MGTALAAALLTTAALVSGIGPIHADAAAAPVAPAPRVVGQALPPEVVGVTPLGPQRVALFVRSPAMNRTVQVQVLLPRDRSKPRPTLYLLDGIDGGAENDYRQSDWTAHTDAAQFFADKNVNVVLPVGGTGSYYTDWQRPDPVLGANRWESFLTGELPPLIDEMFHSNGRNAVAGLSMGASAAMMLITRHPQLYGGVAAYSGCYDLRSQPARIVVRDSVSSRGGQPHNMWGTEGSADWHAHDPAEHPDALRGKQIYMSAGNGLPDPAVAPVDASFVAGTGLEIGARQCTASFARLLAHERIPATVALKTYGMHSWPYWQRDLHNSWPVLQRALGL